jgi:hypothetical protein
MFSPKHPLVFVIRAISFFQVFSVFPLLYYVSRDWYYRSFLPLKGDGPEHEEYSGWRFYLFNFVFLFFPLILAIFYPNVGSLLGILGGVVGYLQIYLLPVLVFLKREKLLISHPHLVHGIEHHDLTHEFHHKSVAEYWKLEGLKRGNRSRCGHEIAQIWKGIKSFFIIHSIDEDELEEALLMADNITEISIPSENFQNRVRRYYMLLFGNIMVLIYGVAIIIFQFV